jgi:hypothetical protein
MSPWISGPSPCRSEVFDSPVGRAPVRHVSKCTENTFRSSLPDAWQSAQLSNRAITRINNPFLAGAEVIRSGSRRNAHGSSRGSSLPVSPVYAGKQLRAPDPMRVNVSAVGFIAAALFGERHHISPGASGNLMALMLIQLGGQLHRIFIELAPRTAGGRSFDSMVNQIKGRPPYKIGSRNK